MRLFPIFLLIVLTGLGVWLGLGLIYPQSESEPLPVSLDPPVPQKSVPEREKAEARAQARMLTLNAEIAACNHHDVNPQTEMHFPSLEEVIQAQIRNGVLLPSTGENLLAENSDRQTFIRLRVGYICQPRSGSPFPVITNDEIDRTVHDGYDPAGMTLQALGISASNP